MYCIGNLTSQAQGRGATPYPTGRWQAGGSRVLATKAEKEVTIYQLIGEPAEEQVSASPSGNSRQGGKMLPFDSLAWWSGSALSTRVVTTWDGGHTCCGYC